MASIPAPNTEFARLKDAERRSDGIIVSERRKESQGKRKECKVGVNIYIYIYTCGK